jgi:hypothetical protein
MSQALEHRKPITNTTDLNSPQGATLEQLRQGLNMTGATSTTLYRKSENFSGQIQCGIQHVKVE